MNEKVSSFTVKNQITQNQNQKENNIGWCIEKGFLIENKVFEPFDLTFRIEDEDTLLDLWHRLNCCEDDI